MSHDERLDRIEEKLDRLLVRSYAIESKLRHARVIQGPFDDAERYALERTIDVPLEDDRKKISAEFLRRVKDYLNVAEAEADPTYYQMEDTFNEYGRFNFREELIASLTYLSLNGQYQDLIARMTKSPDAPIEATDLATTPYEDELRAQGNKFARGLTN